MDRSSAHKLIDKLYDELDKTPISELATPEATPDVARVLPSGKRVVRTKTSGDRVYLLDDAEKTRHWIANPDVLTNLGFDMSDVIDVEDSELIRYRMATALYK